MVNCRFLADLQKFNEWMNVADYEVPLGDCAGVGVVGRPGEGKKGRVE